jgi:hypothetical protein
MPAEHWFSDRQAMKHKLYSDAYGVASAQMQLLEVIAEPVPIEGYPSSRSRYRHRDRGDVAQRLHANAQFALIVSLASFLFPLALPFGLFLGWRVRTEAKRSMPRLVEWVSLPFYVASLGLWLGAAVSLLVLSVVSMTWLR